MKMNDVMELVLGMSSSERKSLVDQILGMMQGENVSQKNGCGDVVRGVRGDRPDCPYCHAEASKGLIMKSGFNKGGAQRFACKSCGRIFVATTNTAFYRSRKNADVWRKFIELTIAGRSIAYCSQRCGLAIQTAFTWRHKVLDVLRMNLQKTQLSGRIEIDEMHLPLSYKGNHIKGAVGTRRVRLPGADNGLPRRSYKRGSDNKPRSSKERACVFCMVGNSGQSFYGSVPGVGFMLDNMLDATLAKIVDKESSVVLADQYNVTRAYLEKNNYLHMILASNTSDNPNDHKPEVQGEHHLQHVNAMHRLIRRFLAPYCGVSSKYLENYISLYVWIRSLRAKQEEWNIREATLSLASAPNSYVTRAQLDARPAIPCCA